MRPGPAEGGAPSVFPPPGNCAGVREDDAGCVAGRGGEVEVDAPALELELEPSRSAEVSIRALSGSSKCTCDCISREGKEGVDTTYHALLRTSLLALESGEPPFLDQYMPGVLSACRVRTAGRHLVPKQLLSIAQGGRYVCSNLHDSKSACQM